MKSVETQIEGLLGQMTLEEKLGEVRGANGMTGYENKRLGIRPFKMADGPHGLRAQGRSTAFPTLVAMAASWNPALAQRMGEVMGLEARSQGVNVILGPCINIHRVPLGGRNFESLSEDPVLAGRFAAAYIQGVQAQGVACSVKHFAVNNQETERLLTSANLDERTLREIYLPAFRQAVKEGGSWTVMAAYNKVNGTYCCENKHLLDEILREEWGFKGLVMSDWGAVHSTVGAAWRGVDVEMPGPGWFFAKPLKEAVDKGAVSVPVIEAKVRRILRTKHFLGLMSKPLPKPAKAPIAAKGRQAALDIARQGLVLLKNEKNLLPLDTKRLRSLAVIGPNAVELRLGGDGSSLVSPTFRSIPLQAIQKQAPGLRIEYALGAPMTGELLAVPQNRLQPGAGKKGQGLWGEYFGNADFKGRPLFSRLDAKLDFEHVWEEKPDDRLGFRPWSARWTGFLVPEISGRHRLGLSSSDGSRLWLDGKLVVDHWKDHYWPELARTEVELKAGKRYAVKIEYRFHSGESAILRFGWLEPRDWKAEAVKAAKACDAAVIFAGLSRYVEGEGKDRTDYRLPEGQEDMCRAVVRANKRTVVVLVNGTAVAPGKWLAETPAVLEAFYPGQEGGQAMAEALFGKINPSGKLPFTWYQKLEDAACEGNYPGDKVSVNYREGIFVGYRHAEKFKVKPLFAFGHGLSYTRFEYSGLKLVRKEGSTEVSLWVKNVGKWKGVETVQVYVSDTDSSVSRPLKELKDFCQAALKPGQGKLLSFCIPDSALRFFDPRLGRWKLEHGRFDILVGASSDDIRLKGSFHA
jgi:beta-glucosidase